MPASARDGRAAGAGRRRHWLPLVGGVVGFAGLAWILSRTDFGELGAILIAADLRYVALVPISVSIEQLARAWKWRQILQPIRLVGILRLFGAVMAGYLANLLAPVGISPLVRSWLVARSEGLPMSTVLASAAVDRLIDALVFAGLVSLVAGFATFPGAGGEIRILLAAGAAASLVGVTAALVLLWGHKRASAQDLGWVLRLTARLPRRLAGRSRALALSFAEGIIWPAETWRRAAIVAASLVIKLVAASHFLWAGLAFGVLLDPFDYLVLVALLGFTVILTHFARIPGGFIFGAVFALALFEVGEERGLAMATVVAAANQLAIGLVGSVTLWRHGIAFSELRSRLTTGGERA